MIGITPLHRLSRNLKDAGVIVSVNSDPRAPVFESSDYCVVSDFRRIVPALIREVRKVKGDGLRDPTPA